MLEFTPHDNPDTVIIAHHAKYKNFCKNIFKKFRKRYIIYVGNKPQIDVPYLICLLVSKLKPITNQKFALNVKFKEIDFIEGIINIIENGWYWTRYKGKISGKYLNKRHNEYVKWGVYECLYRIILLTYYSTNKFAKLKYQSVDSTFIKNLYGEDLYGKCKQYKNKNCTKVSFITDSLGVPFNIAVSKGNKHDSKIADIQLSTDTNLIDIESDRVKKNNKYKQILLADSAYFTANLRKKITQKNIRPIIDVNIRNTRDENKLRMLTEQKLNYKKKSKFRCVIENSFSWLKKYPKMNAIVEKSVKSFTGLVLLACSLTNSKKLDAYEKKVLKTNKMKAPTKLLKSRKTNTFAGKVITSKNMNASAKKVFNFKKLDTYAKK